MERETTGLEEKVTEKTEKGEGKGEVGKGQNTTQRRREEQQYEERRKKYGKENERALEENVTEKTGEGEGK